MTERCTIIITVDETLGAPSFREEDIVKQAWQYMVPFFTKRHGVSAGKITLNDNIHIEWKYDTLDDGVSEDCAYDPDTGLPAKLTLDSIVGLAA